MKSCIEGISCQHEICISFCTSVHVLVSLVELISTLCVGEWNCWVNSPLCKIKVKVSIPMGMGINRNLNNAVTDFYRPRRCNTFHIKTIANFLLGTWFLKENEWMNEMLVKVFWYCSYSVGCWILLFLHTAGVLWEVQTVFPLKIAEGLCSIHCLTINWSS